MYWGLSTYIKAPTPFDQTNQNTDHHSEGLCGNYNGKPEDDFDKDQEVQFAKSHKYIDIILRNHPYKCGFDSLILQINLFYR